MAGRDAVHVAIWAWVDLPISLHFLRLKPALSSESCGVFPPPLQGSRCQRTPRVPLRCTLGYDPVLAGDMVNKTYRLHGEQLSRGNIRRQQCLHALERNKRHGSTHAVHLRLESRSGIKNRAVPPLRHSTPQRLQMGRALRARGPRRARGPFPSPSPSSSTNRSRGGGPHS